MKLNSNLCKIFAVLVLLTLISTILTKKRRSHIRIGGPVNQGKNTPAPPTPEKGTSAQNASSNQEKILGFVQMNRHGARTGDKIEGLIEKLFFGAKKQQLTLNGFNQQRQLGLWIKSRYMGKCLTQDYNPNNFEAYSSSTQRTIFSAAGYLSGLYPDWNMVYKGETATSNKTEKGLTNDEKFPYMGPESDKVYSNVAKKINLNIIYPEKDEVFHSFKCVVTNPAATAKPATAPTKPAAAPAKGKHRRVRFLQLSMKKLKHHKNPGANDDNKLDKLAKGDLTKHVNQKIFEEKWLNTPEQIQKAVKNIQTILGNFKKFKGIDNQINSAITEMDVDTIMAETDKDKKKKGLADKMKIVWGFFSHFLWHYYEDNVKDLDADTVLTLKKFQMEKWYNKKLGNYSPYFRRIAAPYMKEVLASFEKIDGKATQHFSRLYSGHDTMIVYILVNLLRNDVLYDKIKPVCEATTREQKLDILSDGWKYVLVPYASSIIFELYEKNGGKYVRFLYNGKDITGDLWFNKPNLPVEYSEFKRHITGKFLSPEVSAINLDCSGIANGNLA